jgi:hypothetical protein
MPHGNNRPRRTTHRLSPSLCRRCAFVLRDRGAGSRHDIRRTANPVGSRSASIGGLESQLQVKGRRARAPQARQVFPKNPPPRQAALVPAMGQQETPAPQQTARWFDHENSDQASRMPFPCILGRDRLVMKFKDWNIHRTTSPGSPVNPPTAFRAHRPDVDEECHGIVARLAPRQEA